MLELGHLKDLEAAHHVLPEPLEKVLRLQECWEPDTTRPTRLIGPPYLRPLIAAEHGLEGRATAPSDLSRPHPVQSPKDG